MATRVDLVGIKNQIQSNLTAANTTTASPIDLSSNLTRRVQRVLKINPQMIMPQASLFPFVTCYIASKSIEAADISVNQLNAKHKATVNVEVVGAVWNSNFTSVDKDPADDDINYLMENIELTLRNDHNLSGIVKWQKPQEAAYYTVPLDEQSHLRFGVLKLECVQYY